MRSVRFSLVFEFDFTGELLQSCVPFLFCPAQKSNNNEKSGGQREGDLGISSIASSSLGDRKKGYPKRQALWEQTENTPISKEKTMHQDKHEN